MTARSPFEEPGYRSYTDAMQDDLVTREGDAERWELVRAACEELGIDGELTWVGGAGGDAYWVSTVLETFDNGNRAGRRALIERRGGEWRTVRRSSWIN